MSQRPRITRTSFVAFAALATVFAAHRSASAVVIVGADYAGADLTPANGDYLQGTFTNVGTFTVGAGVTVLVDPGNTLDITADRVVVDGTIDGTGGGGGAGAGGGLNGVAGNGPGGGGGGTFGSNVHAGGGGGGGHGGVGGSGAEYATAPGGAGGAAYGSEFPPTFDQGSGGGSAGSHSGGFTGVGGDGGAGGAAISITSTYGYYGATSSILADGQDGKTGIADPQYGSSSGGGGSGGTILLIADYLVVDGYLGADGGQGGDRLTGSDSPDTFAHGGGGGGGGRIKMTAASSFCFAGSWSFEGGIAGISDNFTDIQATDGTDGTISYTAAGSCCGNGTVEIGEDCDDGNRVDGDCCSEKCEADAAGAPCTSDSNACTADVCDGAGTCDHDGMPAATCYVAPKAKIQIGDSATADKDKLKWSWSNGAAFDQSVLGDPLGSTTYTLCVYDSTGGTPVYATALDIAASNTRWTDNDPKGVLYKDKEATSSGVKKVSLKTGLVDKTKVKVQAAGANLPLPGAFGSSYFEQVNTVTVRLVNSAGACWTSEFGVDDTTVNDPETFKAAVK